MPTEPLTDAEIDAMQAEAEQITLWGLLYNPATQELTLQVLQSFVPRLLAELRRLRGQLDAVEVWFAVEGHKPLFDRIISDEPEEEHP